MPQAGEDFAQGLGGHGLVIAVGIDPMHGKAGVGGQGVE
jgi:hypothetical protein